MMKENISSREYATNFYGTAWLNEAQSLHPELAKFSQSLNLDPLSLLISLGREN